MWIALVPPGRIAVVVHTRLRQHYIVTTVGQLRSVPDVKFIQVAVVPAAAHITHIALRISVHIGVLIHLVP
jgi:hypothetical protein